MNISKIETCYKDKLFLSKQKHDNSFSFDTIGIENNLINIYPNIEYQKIIGFGGAFTEAAGYSLQDLNEEKYTSALKEYFSSEGLSYSFCRTHINSCDFSLGNYSYTNTPDLSKFDISHDISYIIPMIKKALKINPDIKLLSSPWSPPAFMKSNNDMNNGGKLIPEYKQLWANYLVKYLEEYEKQGIHIEYMTIQNEPKAVQSWESCIYTSKEESDLVRNYIYPTFMNNNKFVKLLIWDHNKERLFNRADDILNDMYNNSIISGIAFHWYSGDHFENINLVRSIYPDKTLIATEGCTGYSNFNPNDEVMNAEIYGHDYIGNLNSGANAQIDWNMFLDNEGGPNHKNNYCNSPIMMNKDNTDYIKNLTYYYIGHFSKYIKPGAIRIAHSKYTNKFEITTFKNIDNSIIIVLMNTTTKIQDFTFCIDNMIYNDNIKPHSILTYKIWSD